MLSAIYSLELQLCLLFHLRHVVVWMYFLSLLQLSIIVKLTMVRFIIILGLSIKSLFTLRVIYWRFPFVLSPGGGLNRRPVLFAYDPRGPPRA